MNTAEHSRRGCFLRTRAGIVCFILLVTAVAAVVPMLLPGAVGGFGSMGLMLLLIFGGRAFKGSGPAEIGLGRPASWARTLGLALVYSLVAFVVFRLTLEGVFERLTGTERDLSRFAALEGDLPALLIELPIIWVAAAFFEEVYYRGFLITQIAALFGAQAPARQSALGLWVGTLVSAVLFAAVHGYQSLSGVLLTGVGALFFTWIFLRHGRNLWIPMLVHGIHDSSAMAFFYLGIYDRVTGLLF
jgi:membrane protease YdiL (CAAX protease family)